MNHEKEEIELALRSDQGRYQVDIWSFSTHPYSHIVDLLKKLYLYTEPRYLRLIVKGKVSMNYGKKKRRRSNLSRDSIKKDINCDIQSFCIHFYSQHCRSPARIESYTEPPWQIKLIVKEKVSINQRNKEQSCLKTSPSITSNEIFISLETSFPIRSCSRALHCF